MKIVDSFLFSEIYEKELLLIKLKLENNFVTEWILLENAYSFQGDYIGLQAKTLIDSDSRFIPYKDRITIISKEEKTEFLPKHIFLDHLSYKVEYWQRDLAQDYFFKNYNDEDWIMISDVDEIIDFTSPARAEELLSRIKSSSSGLIIYPTKRFWYDFDNEYKLMIGNAMCTKKYLIKNKMQLHEIRAKNRKILKSKWKNIIAFEYSSCYEKEYILRKFYTSTHTGFTSNDLFQSLRCNQRPTRELATWKADNSKYWFFETAKLEENNSPEYVRNNLSTLKTNSIDVNYKLNRRTDYPEFFTLKYYINSFLQKNSSVLKKQMKRIKNAIKNRIK